MTFSKDTSNDHSIHGHVYRQPAPSPPTCSVCRAAALARCQRCGRFFCVDHMTVGADERCNECELQFGNTRRRIARLVGAIVAPVALLLPAALLVLWNVRRDGYMYSPAGLIYSGNLLASLAFTALVIGLVLAAGGFVWRARRSRFLREGGYPQLLDGVEVPISMARPGEERVAAVVGNNCCGHTGLQARVPPVWHRTLGVR